jgi:hypothetical protein
LKPYANNVWIWELQSDLSYEQTLDYCQANLKKCKYEKNEYFHLYRTLGWPDVMKVKSEGYYSLVSCADGRYVYTVEQEYLD